MALKKRKQRQGEPSSATAASISHSVSEKRDEQHESKDNVNMNSFLRRQPIWILLAIASGACAAINGVFAKLTTTSLTGHLAAQLSLFFGLSSDNAVINLALRGTFFGLNLLFNAVMWGLFTAALTRGNSTTRVSIVNVSTNFFITAILGWMIFGEKLPVQWWMGAGLLAAGNVVIGSRDEDERKPDHPVNIDDEEQEGLLGAQEEGSGIALDSTGSKNAKTQPDEHGRIKHAEEIDNPI